MIVNSVEMLANAKKKGCGLPAPDYFDYDSAYVYTKTAEALGIPLILSYAQVFDPFFPLEEAADIGLYFAKRASVPVALHLDHGTTEEFVERAVKLGFSSVMLDASKDSIESNTKRTAAVVKMAHPLGISVEAEIGHVGSGTEEGDDAVYTQADEAEAFVKATGVDSLAVSIGTAHGVYKKMKPVLNFERLSEISKLVDVPLVLHGGSGTGDDNITKCVQLGICKVNVYTEFLQACGKAFDETVGADLHVRRAAAKDNMRSVLEHYFKICRSAEL